MVHAMVERATSDMLIGPDWAMNLEICDICNNDPAQAKEVVKGINKRLRSKNSKVQLLSLTLLETIVKNCGDIVHMYVADKELPHRMVKIVKKKPDFHVKEKILILINTWQEDFGGSRARYPQYYLAYQDLLHLGVVFPQRCESSAPLFRPPQTHPLTSNPQNLHNPESTPGAAESSAEAEFPTLSMTEIENARGIMDVLAEMLNALDPGNKEGVKQDVIIDLVEQCRAFKHRVVHLVNSTTDESLLHQGLALNDDLQRVLAKHESISSGGISGQLEKGKTEEPLVNVDAPIIGTSDTQSENGSTSISSVGTQLLLPAPPAANAQPTASTSVDPNIDLLSWDGPPNSLALVPAGEIQPASPHASQKNAPALIDMFSLSNDQSQPQTDAQSSQLSLHSNGSVSGPMLPPHKQSLYLQDSATPWDGHINQQQQDSSPVYGAVSDCAFPRPPWEAQRDESQSAISETQQLQPSPSSMQLPGPQTKANDHEAVGMYMQPQITGGHFTATNNQDSQIPGAAAHPMAMHPQPAQSGHFGYIYPQQMMYDAQMAAYGYGYGYGYSQGQGQPQNNQFLEQSMLGLSMDGAGSTSRQGPSTALYVPSGKPVKPEDKLFGDLVDISKFKPAKT